MLPQTIPGPPSHSSNHSSFFDVGSVQASIVSALCIPHQLLDRSPRDIRISYAKYEAYIDACRQLSKLTAEGLFPKRPSNDDIIEVFFAKSTYFKHQKVFPLVKKVPIVERWMKSDEGVSDVEVWNSRKQNFDNLNKVLNEHLLKDVEAAGKEMKISMGKGKKKAKDCDDDGAKRVRKGKGKKKESDDESVSKKASSSKHKV